MTQQEFYEDCRDLGDVVRIASDYDYYDLIDDYRHYDDIDDFINEVLLYDNQQDWRDLRETLDDIYDTVENYNWFYVGDYGVQGITDCGYEFTELRSELLNQLMADGYIEPDIDEEDIENTDIEISVDEDEEEEDVFAIEEDISIFEAVEEGSQIQMIVVKEPVEVCEEVTEVSENTEEIPILFQ